MKSYEIVSSKRTKFILIELANKNTGGIIIALLEAQLEMVGMPQNSVFILTDAWNVVEQKEKSIAMKEFSSGISPYVKAYAMLGTHGLRSVLSQAAATLIKLSDQPCDDFTKTVAELAGASQ